MASEPINFNALIEEFELHAVSDVGSEELELICESIITELNNNKMIEDIKSGKKKNSIKFLVGQAMRISQGRIQAQEFEITFKRLLGVEP